MLLYKESNVLAWDYKVKVSGMQRCGQAVVVTLSADWVSCVWRGQALHSAMLIQYYATLYCILYKNLCE